jgi:signal transduction histidine kinase
VLSGLMALWAQRFNPTAPDAVLPAHVLVGGAACAALWLRRRWPVGLAVVLIVVSMLELSASGAMLAALYTVAANRPFRVAAVLAIPAVLTTPALAILRPLHGQNLQMVMGSIVYDTAVMCAAITLGMFLRSRRALECSLQDRARRAEAEASLRAEQARLREQRRIAQDMHDSLGHHLALVAVHTGSLEMDPALQHHQAKAVGVLRQAATAAMQELRAVVGVLRDEEIAEVTGGLRDIGHLIEAARTASGSVQLRRQGDARPLLAATDHAAYRIVQEALTNVHKHAPAAAVTVELRYEPDCLVVEITNGPATTPVSPALQVIGGHGLTGLRERAQRAGGLLHTGPTPDGGFRVAAILPYQPTSPDPPNAAGSQDKEPAAETTTSQSAAGADRRAA